MTAILEADWDAIAHARPDVSYGAAVPMRLSSEPASHVGDVLRYEVNVAMKR